MVHVIFFNYSSTCWKAAQDKLAKVNELMDNLKRQYEEKLAEKARLQADAEETAMKLDRAGKLVSGLAGEKVRWEASAAKLEESMGYLVGDCLIV